MNITKDYFDGKNVLIFGYGTNGGGSGTLAFLLTTQAKQIIVTDQKNEDDLKKAGIPLPDDPRILWHLGGHTEKDFITAEIVIKSPGIPWDNPFLLAAQKNGAEIVLDSTIFMALCPAPVIGITGSKGKTTTASLIAHILETAGQKVIRVGISQTGVLSELSKVTEKSVVVFELSSWRLSGLQAIKKSPHISVLTSLYPDHLNYYESMEAYAEDKKIITKFQTSKDTFVVPAQSDWTTFFTEDSQAQIVTFGTTRQSEAWQDEEGLWLQNETLEAEPVLLLKKKISLLSGEHIFSNMLAAALAAKAFEVPVNAIQEGLKTFTGVPHRSELVREVSGVKYINDTAATIPSASLASVKSLSGPVILLAGGSDKELPFDDLVQAIEISKFAVLFEGSGTEKLLLTLPEKSRAKVYVATNMHDAVIKAKSVAQPGDTVLLAPGAASFGMFKNEFDRGQQFTDIVQSL